MLDTVTGEMTEISGSAATLSERAERLHDLLSPFTASETGADTDVFVPGKSGGQSMHTD